ncbi:MAG: bifunctional DNA-formamidopyrimidine glycosylase/DNA-(apurinic or apyrimidinic site) lyase [Gammaproteobacteria bacterium]
MPELPEVETTRRGIEPHIINQTITHITVRERRLRWPVTPRFEQRLAGAIIQTISRRGKYLICQTSQGYILIHLGMSGSLRIILDNASAEKHDHIDIRLDTGAVVRYSDPRRFGTVQWIKNQPEKHPLLATLGPEPLSSDFNTHYLHSLSRNRKIAIKSLIMNSRVVTGVGNIYASESLFLAGIHPARAAGRISQKRYQSLVAAIKQTLEKAIAEGGTTLRDFVNADGKPGYFQQSLQVYDRAGQACLNCGQAIKLMTTGQRSTFYCGHCQR